MKNRIFLLLVLISFIPACRSGSGKKDLNPAGLMTIRSLGLAYLEEFKLEEAEKEFLKFIDLAPADKFGYANLGLTYLRMGKYEEAEKQLTKALGIEPADADIRLILATVYQMMDKRDMAISELKKALEYSPAHAKVLYQITELYGAEEGDDASIQRQAYLVKLVESAPSNLVPRLNLTDIYIRKGETDKALEQIEIIKKQFPEFPKEAVEFYSNTFRALKNSDLESASTNFAIFHNYIKVTPPYQAGMMDLKGPGGSLIGFPVITFDKQISSLASTDESLLDILKYTDATESAGLNIIKGFSESESEKYKQYSHITNADFDGDGDVDLYAGSWDQATSGYKHYLLKNDMGHFTEISEAAGITHQGLESDASFADYNNDGFLDLFVVREEGDILYFNNGNGTFTDVTASSGITGTKGGNRALSFDLDHDGDLDLFEMTSDLNRQLRNNADGTFTDQSAKMGEQAKGIKSTDAAFGDFDEDEDIDLVVVNENGCNIFYSNQRLGVFKDVTVQAGLVSRGGTSSVTTGDYNNDGFLDLFITSYYPGECLLYTNNGSGSFIPAENTREMFTSLQNVKTNDAAFLDFNNDGFLDLFIAGESVLKNERGLFLFYNDGKGMFTDVSKLLPPYPISGMEVSVFDFNIDGDLDIVIAGTDGKIYLLRNDGGNNNHYVGIKLMGLKAGSAKNNHFGIGAKVEIRAGELYQSMVVTDPYVHFGIGKRPLADVIRITWTNGVPQNIFFPVTDKAAIEAQILKGSCPFLYTWNGKEYTFVKDILWRSGLGMPMGIGGGATAYAFADASDDYLKIPGDVLKPRKGSFSMQVTSELWETIYMDQLQLVAVDHPAETDIYVAEQFSPPPFPGMDIYQVDNKKHPVSAVDSDGSDLLPFILEKDDIYTPGYLPGKYQGITEMKDMILDPGETGGSGKIFLFMTGWIFPTDASINYALSQSESLTPLSPVIQVINKEGNWETVIANAGFPMGKDKTVVVDLSGKFLSADHRIRIRTNMEIYWDQMFFAAPQDDGLKVISVLDPSSADLHYRGFSRSYRKGGRYGPHWFDYSVVDKDPRWRDLPGNYTRYGDVLPLLMKPDNKYIISNAGDEVTVEFSARELPPLKKGWKRDFLIRSVGWVKDGDMNTAFGYSVLPLPFHGMKSYPPSESDIYPDDPDLQQYNREYNTRVITKDTYLNAVKQK